MESQTPPQTRFSLIHRATQQADNLLNISRLCEAAGVSRSGYYRWCAAEDSRKAREEADRKDFEQILKAYRHRGYDKGAEGIHMRLLHNPGIIMNVKKIRRLMRKYGLCCPIRKANPYRRMMKAIQTNTTAPNVVNREFRQSPRKVLLTDISYMRFKNGTCYLSTILDAFTHEVLAYRVSDNLKVDFVLETVDRLIAGYGSTLDDNAIVHSDQGAHYTSYKDEIASYVAACVSLEDVTVRVDDWIDYYNNERGQWSLKKLTPSEYFKYQETGIYPLPVSNTRYTAKYH